MSLKQAINFARNASEEKVPFRFQFPVHTKDEFDCLCEKHNVTMSDMILGLIQSSIDEDKGISEVGTLNIVNKIGDLEKYLKEVNRMFIETNGESIECVDGV